MTQLGIEEGVYNLVEKFYNMHVKPAIDMMTVEYQQDAIKLGWGQFVLDGVGTAVEVAAFVVDTFTGEGAGTGTDTIPY
jgi:hypothetical protein